MKIKKVLPPLLLILLTLTAFGQEKNITTTRLDNLYNTFFEETGVGCAVLVSKSGEVIYEKGFGLADIEASLPATRNHVFRIGSLTKQFTAIAILQLQEQGKLSLNDEVQKYVPDFPVSPTKLTIENLLTHTSGLKNLTEIEDLPMKQSPYTPQELIDIFKTRALDFNPGEHYRYSNSGYILLGYVIEKLSGKTYADYLKLNIFDKLGMTESYYDNAAQIIKGRARGYDLDSNFKLVNSAYLNTTFPYSAGGLVMTVRDYYKWHQGLLANKLVKAETLKKAWSPFRLNDKTYSNYGYGWSLGDVSGSKKIEHGGRINGFNCKETYLPEEEILVITLSNGGFVNTDIINDLASAIVADKPEVKEVQISSKAKNDYLGTYSFAPNDPTTIRIYEENGQLYLKDSNSPVPWRMYFTKENEFICYEVFPNTHFFTRNKEGKIDYLIIKNFNHEVKVKRVQP